MELQLSEVFKIYKTLNNYAIFTIYRKRELYTIKQKIIAKI